MAQVSRFEFSSIIRAQREKAAIRKAKREEKRATLPWGRPQAQVQKKRGRPSEHARLEKVLDDLWSYFIKLRDKLLFGGLCRICGSQPIQVAYHIISRGHGAIRVDLENGCGACCGCNWWELKTRQQRPAQVRERHIKIFGLELIERLEAKKNQSGKMSVGDLREKIEWFKNQIKELIKRRGAWLNS